MATTLRTLLLLAALGSASVLRAARERPGGDDPVVANVEAVMLEGDLVRARTIIEVALRKTAKPLYYAIRGGILGELGELPDAIKDLTRAVELDPKLAVAWRDRGMARMLLGEYESALPDLDTAVKADPEEPKAWATRAALQLRRKAWNAAIADTTEALRLEPRMISALHDRATARAQLGELQEAVADYDAILAIKPRYPLALTARAQVHRRLGDLDQALADADAAIRVDANAADAYTERAAIRGVMGDLSRAIGDCTTALLIEPEHASALIVRALLQIQNTDFRAARTDLEAALVQPGVEPSAPRRHLAWLLATAPDDSLLDAARALKLAHEVIETYGDKSPPALDALAAAAAANGDFATAMTNAELALQATDARTPLDLTVRRERLELYLNRQPYRLSTVREIAEPQKRKVTPTSTTPAEKLIVAGEYGRARDLLEEGLHYGLELPQAILATLAYLLATCPDDGIRDGARALTLAQKAAAKDGANPVILDALAAALAETARFPEAIEAATQSVDATRPEETASLALRRARLETYRDASPWRLPPARKAPPAKR